MIFSPAAQKVIDDLEAEGRHADAERFKSGVQKAAASAVRDRVLMEDPEYRRRIGWTGPWPVRRQTRP